ncbi:MAG: peptide ABC transporter substrate-binding protein [Planctomycetaceae bacterium]|nr:peptide ABC transporter substrate-binding protein [Planctomycetaceae bacterium]|tara:strand:+ start:5460 stop:6443 length:984 start_codon:yes stop_codon:yes gene_type:complete
MSTPLLQVRDLKVHFKPPRRGFGKAPAAIRAVDGVSFDVEAGQTLGLVGESGCGKSTTARAVLNLIRNAHREGEVILDGTQIDHLGEAAMRPYRAKAQMVFQDPFASLNPRMTVGKIIREPMRNFGLGLSDQDEQLEVIRLMELVGINPRYMNRYPHEFSGGQRQRIGIARALAVQPQLIVCDEAVSALDVSIQAQVINLLMDLQQKLGVAYVFISHDLAVVRHIANRVGVMYLGRIVELASSDELYRDPKHPYTKALLSAAPVPDPDQNVSQKRVKLEGEVPSPDIVYPGCPFADRCPEVLDQCHAVAPQLSTEAHKVSCLLFEDF